MRVRIDISEVCCEKQVFTTQLGNSSGGLHKFDFSWHECDWRESECQEKSSSYRPPDEFPRCVGKWVITTYLGFSYSHPHLVTTTKCYAVFYSRSLWPDRIDGRHIYSLRILYYQSVATAVFLWLLTYPVYENTLILLEQSDGHHTLFITYSVLPERSDGCHSWLLLPSHHMEKINSMYFLL